MKTWLAKSEESDAKWWLVDATGQTLGHLATQVTNLIRGKHKPTFTPHTDTGDFVVVINASRLKLTTKRLFTKFYYHHSGYPGGLKTVSLRDQLKTHPDRVIRHAVWGMLPHNKMGRRLIKKLRVYGGSVHPHIAQNPKPLA